MKKEVVLYFSEHNQFVVVKALLPKKKKLTYGASVKKVFKTSFKTQELIYLGVL